MHPNILGTIDLAEKIEESIDIFLEGLKAKIIQDLCSIQNTSEITPMFMVNCVFEYSKEMKEELMKRNEVH